MSRTRRRTVVTVPAPLLAAAALGTALLAALSAGAAPVSPGCDGQRATIVGTPHRDVLGGTDGPDGHGDRR
jgi:hypothetical protein